MVPSAPSGAAASPFGIDANAPPLDRLLADLRRRTWGDPLVNARELLRLAAPALAADAIVVWLADAAGSLAAAAHHVVGADAAAPDALGAAPSVAALRDATASSLVGTDGPAAVLDTGIWAQGQLVGAVRARRSGDAPWGGVERLVAQTLADRLAVEAVGEGWRLARHALREREQQMERIERLAEIGTWDLDLVNDRITWSGEQLRIHGLDATTAPRTSAEFLALVHPDDRAMIVAAMDRLCRSGTPFNVEYRIVRPDGAIRLLTAPGRLVPGPDGQLTRMMGTSLDITERRATELALRASEESYRAIFDSSNDAIFVHDLDTGAILDANRRACEFSAVTLDELRGGGLSIIANGPPPFTADRAVDHMQRAARGEPVRFEWMTIHPKTKEELWVEVGLQRVTIRGADRLLALVRDIRERKRAELALLESEASYRTIFQHASDAMWLHDIGTSAFLEVNDAAVELLGYSAEEQKQLGVEGTSDGREPYTLDHGRAYMERAMAGEPQRFEWLSRHKDGSPVWEEVTLRRVSVRGADRILATARGINDRKAAEQALRASEESYRTIFQNASDAMWVHDVDTGAFLDVNEAACEMYGFSAEEQLAMGVPGLTDGRPPFTPERGLAYLQAAARGEPQRFEWLGRHKDGHSVWGEVRLRRVTIGGVDRILATARDINDRKVAEEALRDANEALERRVAARTAELAASNAALAQEVTEHAHAKDALLERTRELEGIFQALPDLYFRLGPDLTILDYRAPSRDTLYVPPEAFLGKRMREVLPPDVCDRFDEALAAAPPGELATAEYQLPAGHEVRDFEARFFPLGDGTRISVIRDITERKRVERALQERQEQLHETQRIARLGSWHWEVATGALVWDPVLCELYGVTPETAPRDFAGYLALVHPQDRELAKFVTEEAFQRGEPFAFDHRVVLPDGTIRYLHGRGNIVKHADGSVARMVGSAQDVSERKAAERTLREREEHFRRLIENTSDGVTFVDASGTVRYQSPSMEGLLGYARGARIGQSTFDPVHPDDRESTRRIFAEITATPGVTRSAVYRLQRADGTWRTVESIARTIRPDSASEGVVINTRDITERQAAEAALARAKEEAERANRAKSEFLSRMSHELRTPMNSILGFAQLLARAELPPQQVKSVQHILKAGRHLLHLINEVLEIARIEAGRENFSLEPVGLASVLQEAFGLVRPLAQQLEVELREGVWPREAFVQADRQRLVQVLLNLLSNAIKYNRPRGYVRLTCAATEGRWTVRVEDGGRGIPPDRVSQLFTPFARLGAEQTDVEGTGLGLALSRRLCEAMGGTLALERTDDTGSVFAIELAATEDPLHALEVTGVHAIVAPPHRTATLLYVEDNLANLSLVDTILLSRPGWRTLPALQGQLGVELAREHVPDLVLLDLHLPDISGEEVLRRLRADARTARIPVVIVSADATTASLERLRAAGADGYLTKPLDVDEFLRVVERFLPASGGRGA